MKLASVYLNNLRHKIRTPDGEKVFVVFKWWNYHAKHDMHQLHLLAFVTATTEDLKWQVLQGVFAIHWGRGYLWVEFCPGDTVYRWGKYP